MTRHLNRINARWTLRGLTPLLFLALASSTEPKEIFNRQVAKIAKDALIGHLDLKT